MWLSLHSLSLLVMVSAVSSRLPQPQHILQNPVSADQHGYQIPTSRESAVLARRVLALTPLGTLSTVFPVSSPESTWSGVTEHAVSPPHELAGLPIGLMDYIADCSEASTGDPTILAIDIATSFRNVAAGSNISLSMRWTPPYPPSKRMAGFPSWLIRTDTRAGDFEYSAANLPRFSLIGYLETIPQEEVRRGKIAKCFTKTHPDARYWLPGNSIHESQWTRLVVQRVYWIGGFGDRAYIGWIPVEEWRNVSRDDWEAVRLPGEKKGWKEWHTSILDIR